MYARVLTYIKLLNEAPVHAISVHIEYVKMLLINTYADLSSEARRLNFDLGFHLYPYYVYACSACSGEPAHMCRLA